MVDLGYHVEAEYFFGSGAAQLPKIYRFNSDLGDEDCLYLNVFASPSARDLPVTIGGELARAGVTFYSRPPIKVASRKASQRQARSNQYKSLYISIPLSLPYIETTTDFKAYIGNTFPRFITLDVNRLLEIYSFASSSPDPFSPLYDTLSDYRLTTLVDTFSRDNAKENIATPIEGIRHAFQKILGSFIIKDSLVISIQDTKGGASNAILREDLGVVNHLRLANAYLWEGGRGERYRF
ncbi:CAZyme family CE10 [Penicillium tannophilum]|nr:CAZyme family CE10 [Penicillium tannophilum]